MVNTAPAATDSPMEPMVRAMFSSRIDPFISRSQLFQPGFEERRAPGADGIHLEPVAVHAHHAMTKVRQAGGGDTSYIAKAQDGDLLGIGDTRNRIHAL